MLIECIGLYSGARPTKIETVFAITQSPAFDENTAVVVGISESQEGFLSEDREFGGGGDAWWVVGQWGYRSQNQSIELGREYDQTLQLLH